MKLIPLTRGYFAQVDDEDFEWLIQWKWCYGCGYARRNGGPHSVPRSIFMHRVILNATNTHDHVDHIDGNGLNNQRLNIRRCSRTENSRNTRIPVTNTSGFKGLVNNQRLGKWESRIKINGALVYLGVFRSKEDAARAYNEAAVKNFGEFARLNNVDPLFPTDQSRLRLGLSDHNTSGYRGVSCNPRNKNMWIASIRLNGKKHYIGRFETPEDAARAFDAKAKQARGEKTRLNFPDG